MGLTSRSPPRRPRAPQAAPAGTVDPTRPLTPTHRRARPFPEQDPKAPKNPTSSYMFFATDARKRISASSPGQPWLTAAIPIENRYCSCMLTRDATDMSFTEIGKQLGKQWCVAPHRMDCTPRHDGPNHLGL